MKKIAFLVTFLLATITMTAQQTSNQSSTKPKGTRVQVETNYGKMVFLLYDETPKHRDNFLKLVKDGTYNGLLFHRVIKNFMIQGGDPESKNARKGQMLGSGTLGYTVPAEIRTNLFHKRGALCAARQGDEVNPTKASSASQFYIVQGNVWDNNSLDMMARRSGKTFSTEQRKIYTTVGGTPHLDGEYTVFGEVIEGMNVVDKIANVRCDRMDRPEEDVKIIKMTILK